MCSGVRWIFYCSISRQVLIGLHHSGFAAGFARHRGCDHPIGSVALVVLKSITLARDLLHTPVLGLVENMTSYVCPTCEQVHPLFGPTSSEEMPLGVPLLGRIPFDPRMAAAGDRGTRISWSMVPPLRDRRCSRWESAYARV